MKQMFRVFAAMLIVAGAAWAEPISPRAFTDAFAAAATAALPGAKVTVTGDLQTDTRTPGGKTVTSDLHNAYASYLERPQVLDAVIQRYIAPLADLVRLSDTPALDRSHIVPVFKSNLWLETLRRDRKAQNLQAVPEPLTESYNSVLTIVYAEDRPAAVRFLTTRDDVGDRAKLHDLALGNLHRLLPKIELRPGADGIFLIEAGGQYESSLLLADAIWSGGQIKVDGDIVVAVPAKDALLVTGSRNRKGLARLRALAVELAAGPYGLTKALLVYRGGKFVEFAE